MDFTYSITEKEFVDEVRTWLEEHIVGEFVSAKRKRSNGHDDVPAELQIEWEKELAKGLARHRFPQIYRRKRVLIS